MHRKTQKSLLTTLVLLSLLATTPYAFAEESKISSSSQQQIQNHTEDLSLQQRIDTAEAGATLQFPNGTYTEVLTINKPLHITGDGTILNPTSSTNGYAIQITAEDVILSNLQISNQASGLYTTGVKISASNTTIQNCLFSDTPIGIAVWNSGNTISQCTFQRCTDEGIVLLGTEERTCGDNTIITCLFSENCDGIELQHASTNQIISCSFTKNTHAGIDAIESDNNNNIISDCIFTHNRAFGLYLARSNQNLITHCTFTDDVLTLVHAPQNRIEKSQIQHIHLLDDSSLLLDQCINTTTETIVADQSTYEIQPHNQAQKNIEDTLLARYHQVLIYLLSHLKTFKTFIEQFSQARM
jgi:parallel beta-helix repeat protein